MMHLRFQERRDSGVFERLWLVGLLEYDGRHGLEWEWQAKDWAITKATFGEKERDAILHTAAKAALTWVELHIRRHRPFSSFVAPVYTGMRRYSLGANGH